MENTLPKEERLSGKTSITDLVSEGRWGSVSGLKYCYRQGSGKPCNRLMVSVPKKFFKRAVKRNLLKRRIRESYRTQKRILPLAEIDLMILYNTKDIMDSETIRGLVETILSRISKSIQNPSQDNSK